MRSRFGIVATATAAFIAAIAGTSCNKEEQNTGFKENTAVSWTPSEESYTIRVGETAKGRRHSSLRRWSDNHD